MKRLIDVPNSERVKRAPDKTIPILSNGSLVDRGYKIKKIELRSYIEKRDAEMGPYSLITSYVETDLGSVEMLYDEGYRGDTALERAADFLMNCLGVSGLVLRSIISLQSN